MSPDRKLAFNFTLLDIIWIHMICTDKQYFPIRRIKNKQGASIQPAVQLRTGKTEVWLMHHTIKMQKSCQRRINRSHWSKEYLTSVWVGESSCFEQKDYWTEMKDAVGPSAGTNGFGWFFLLLLLEGKGRKNRKQVIGYKGVRCRIKRLRLRRVCEDCCLSPMSWWMTCLS